MNVIFLDFNGVLDTYENMDIIDHNNLLRLKKIVYETNSKIVISSSLKNNSFRDGKYTENLLNNFINPLQAVGIDVIGITPNKDTREKEIEFFLEEHQEIDNFIILDDEYEFNNYKDNFIKLPYLGNGLEDIHVEMAINILNKNKKTLTK